MKAIIQRDWYTDKQTTGYLRLVNSENQVIFACSTLELADKNNQKSISCIPKGVYTCVRIVSPRLGVCYSIQNVPNRQAILIHVGNFSSEIKGCILIGQGLLDVNKDNYKDVISSQNCMNWFQKIAGHSFTLIIE